MKITTTRKDCEKKFPLSSQWVVNNRGVYESEDGQVVVVLREADSTHDARIYNFERALFVILTSNTKWRNLDVPYVVEFTND
jgi:hypothetical protein